MRTLPIFNGDGTVYVEVRMGKDWSISVDMNNNRAFLPSDLWDSGDALVLLPDSSVFCSVFASLPGTGLKELGCLM